MSTPRQSSSSPAVAARSPTTGGWNRRWRLQLGALLSVAATSGCGSAAYSYRINAASSRLEEARTLGAEQKAAYEYYSAQVRLAEARHFAARAEYGSAIQLAEEAEGFSGKAIRKSKEADDAPPGARTP